MAITVEELEIIVKANVTQAMQALKQTKKQIEDTFQKTMPMVEQAAAQANQAVAKTMTTTATKSSLLTRQIELQREKVQRLKDELDAGQGGTAYLDKTRIKLEQAEISLEKLILRANQPIAKKAAMSLREYIKQATKATKENVPLAKSIIKVGTLMKTMLIRQSIRAFFTAFNEGIQAMATVMPSVNAQMSEFKSALYTARNGFTAALYPAIQIITPLLVKLGNLVVWVGNKFAEMYAIISGKGTFVKAGNAVVDYASSLNGAAKAAKRSLAPFDQLNVLTQQQAEGGAGAGLGANFEVEEVSTKMEWFKKIVETVKTALNGLSDWFEKNKPLVETFAIIVGSFAAAWVLVNGALAVFAGFKSVIAVIGAGIAVMTSPIGLVILALGAAIAVGVLLYKNWDKIKEAGIKAWEETKAAWKETWGWYKKNVIDPIWNGFKWLFNGAIGFVEGFINAFINGINAVKEAINKIGFTVPDWVPVVGGKNFSPNLQPTAPINIPRLANGGVLKRPTLNLAGEYAGASSNPEIVTPEKLMRSVFLSSQIPMINAIEEMSDRLVQALKESGVEIELDGKSLVRAIKPYQQSENTRVGSVAYVR